MPSTRYSFSANTKYDLDIIRYLDEFNSPADRNVAIKAAIRAQMDDLEAEKENFQSIETIADGVQRILTLLAELRASGVQMPTDITVQTPQGEKSIALENIDNLLFKG
jgi:hypothetical protein